MRALVLCGDLHHRAATARIGLAPLSTHHGFHFDWIENTSKWAPSELESYQAVVLTKSNVLAHGNPTPWLTPETSLALAEFVQRGGGLLTVHSGLAGYGEIAPLRTLVGGKFISHPPACEVSVKSRPDHPVTAGVESSFRISDEHYVIAADPGVDIFLHTSSVHGVQPGGWTRTDGLGRVCALAPGHTTEVWLQPSFQKLLLNSLTWVGER